jgi:hypothetical protein
MLLAAVMLTAAVSVQAEWVNGYLRSNGTYVNGYYRSTAPSYTYANASYTSYTPSSAIYTYSSTTHPSYSSSCDSYPSSYSVYGSSSRIGGTTFHNYSSSDGGSLSGTTLTIGNTSFTSLYGW